MVKFDTTLYEKVHGKKPKGKRIWLFQFEDGRNAWGNVLMNYGYAKKHLKKHICFPSHRGKVVIVKVLP